VLALSDQDVFEEVFVTSRRAYAVLPDLRVTERPGWLQVVTPSLGSRALNQVLLSVLDERDADAVIDRAIAGYRELGVPFRWYVGPGSAPPDLGDRLARRGLVAHWGRGMARSTEPIAETSGPIEVAEVDASTVELFTGVAATGWNLAPGPLLAMHRAMLEAPDRRHHLFLASCDGAPAAAASYVAFPRSAFLIGGVALPGHRRRGLYRALVTARLAHARARGIPIATSHADDTTSAPILERLGFATVHRFAVYFG